MEPTKHCLGVREDEVSSDWVLQRGDTNGLTREAEAICVRFAWSTLSPSFVTLITLSARGRSEDEYAKLRRVLALG